jgi:hypothetical protein
MPSLCEQDFDEGIAPDLPDRLEAADQKTPLERFLRQEGTSQS